MTVKEFCKYANITEDQFYGRVAVGGSLDLRSVTSIPEGFNPIVGGSLYLGSVTSIPEGFNPTVGGSLDLGSVTSIPEGFNPIVGGYLDLGSVTSIPEGFNPTVGGYLDLRSVTSIPEGFNPTVGGYLYLGSVTSIPEGFNKSAHEYMEVPFMKWGKGNGTHIYCDGRFSEVVSKRGNVWRLKDVGKSNEYYLVSDGGNNYAHGATIKEAKEDLLFKVTENKLKKEPIKEDTVITMSYYRAVTGACREGMKNFIEKTFTGKQKEKVLDKGIKAKELLPILKKSNAYGFDKFKSLVTF